MGPGSWERSIARGRGSPGGELVNHTLGQISAQENVLPSWRVVGVQRGPASS